VAPDPGDDGGGAVLSSFLASASPCGWDGAYLVLSPSRSGTTTPRAVALDGDGGDGVDLVAGGRWRVSEAADRGTTMVVFSLAGGDRQLCG
jgi:hypothetical protein